ncbi:MBL fold metallo-hydrolase [Candidatus Woesearchaeota archaeon]|nr:MBL fold metallo-hydrolase [Candidatus Woesearchaeota archaeon]
MARLEWLGHAAFRVSDGKVIYVDPFQIAPGEKADIVLITHPHYDHCSVEDLRKVVKLDTIIVAPIDCQSKIASGKLHYAEFKNVAPGSSVSIYGCSIKAVPAYNTNKHFHSKGDEWVGYVFEVNGVKSKKLYHAGDTDFINDMVGLAGMKIDFALLPVGGTYTMNAREAAQAVAMIKPKVVIPMHYGSIVGSLDDAEVFRRSVAHSAVRIMEKGSVMEI